MLTHIHIRDFAIVERLELDLERGMTAMTGETGAGKSILVDALGLALGDRADIGVIRHGAERAEIVAQFDLAAASDAGLWLEQHDLAEDNDCLLRRVITAEGRSRAYINGRPVPVQSLRELGDLLVDIHGQHEHQSLLRRETQRQLLDDFAGNGELLSQLDQVYRDLDQRQRELQSLRTAAADRSARLDLLRFQVQELESADLRADEPAQITEEHGRAANAGQLLETSQAAIAALYESDEDNVHDRLSRVHADLDGLCDLDNGVVPIRELINEAMIQVQEAVDQLRTYVDRLDLDPSRLQWLEDRLGLLHGLSRKHHVAAESLPDVLIALQTELHSLDNADERLGALQDEIDGLRGRYHELAAQLTRRRRDAARTLNNRVSDVIGELGMTGAAFEIAVETAADAKPAAHGLERVEFQVRTNPGQPLKTLAKIASGGELSRFSLAIQVVLADSTRIASLIYDEVDTGIGGAVAEVVGRRLRALGDGRQVLCVTHLPQVAAQAHHHLQVSKQNDAQFSGTRIARLDPPARIEEVARMLGGVEISAQTRAHAEEMIEKAQAAVGGGTPVKPRGKPRGKRASA